MSAHEERLDSPAVLSRVICVKWAQERDSQAAGWIFPLSLDVNDAICATFSNLTKRTKEVLLEAGNYH